MRVPPPDLTKHLPKTPSLHPIVLGIRIPTYVFWGETNIWLITGASVLTRKQRHALPNGALKAIALTQGGQSSVPGLVPVYSPV